MKLLMVSPYPIYPTNDGGRVRIRQIATHLSERHDIHLTAPGDDGDEASPFVFHHSPGGGRGRAAQSRKSIEQLSSMERST